METLLGIGSTDLKSNVTHLAGQYFILPSGGQWEPFKRAWECLEMWRGKNDFQFIIFPCNAIGQVLNFVKVGEATLDNFGKLLPLPHCSWATGQSQQTVPGLYSVQSF